MALIVFIHEIIYAVRKDLGGFLEYLLVDSEAKKRVVLITPEPDFAKIDPHLPEIVDREICF